MKFIEKKKKRKQDYRKLDQTHEKK